VKTQQPGEQNRVSSFGRDLFLLASEKSSAKRVELLRRITDAYLEQSDEHTSAEHYLFEEIVTKLVGKVSRTDRIRASTDLSKLPELPEALARRLASDSDIEVARPIVRDHHGLSEAILIEVATHGSQEHLHAIATRPVVTPPVTDVVVTRGDGRTVRTLTGNQGAQFSNEGMRTLIGRAEADVDLQALLVERADLSLEAINKLLPMVSQELATRLHGRAVEIDVSSVQNHLLDWMDDRKKNIERIEAYIERLRRGDLMLDVIAMKLIRNKRLLDTATIFAAMIDLDRYFGFNVLTRGKAQSVLLLLKSINLSWQAVDGFLELRRDKLAIDEDRVDRSEYEAIDTAAAQRVVRFLKVRRSTTARSSGAIAC
jgi:hypothetical protein